MAELSSQSWGQEVKNGKDALWEEEEEEEEATSSSYHHHYV